MLVVAFNKHRLTANAHDIVVLRQLSGTQAGRVDEDTGPGQGAQLVQRGDSGLDEVDPLGPQAGYEPGQKVVRVDGEAGVAEADLGSGGQGGGRKELKVGIEVAVPDGCVVGAVIVVLGDRCGLRSGMVSLSVCMANTARCSP